MGRLLAFRSCLDMAIRGFNTIADLYSQVGRPYSTHTHRKQSSILKSFVNYY